MATNLLIHDRLGDCRLVGFVMSLAPVAHQIYDHILVEMIAIIQRQSGDKNDCFGVIPVDMEYGGLHHLCYICAVGGGAFLVNNGDLVIMQSTALNSYGG